MTTTTEHSTNGAGRAAGATSRVALITGASRGLGRTLATFLAPQGYTLILTARGADALAATADELRNAFGVQVTALAGDVAEPAHRRALAAAAAGAGRLDLLANNASILGPSPQPELAGYPLETLEQVFAANVLAPLGLAGAGARHRRQHLQRRGRRRLAARGVEIAPVTLHTGVSSLEVETDAIEAHALYPEPFDVPAATARAVNETRCRGGRVVAVGTTVVRALESAWNGEKVIAARGFTRRYIHRAQGVHAVGVLLTGFHDPYASHLAMLYAVAGQALVRDAYAAAVAYGYLWHEFGDSHLILPQPP